MSDKFRIDHIDGSDDFELRIWKSRPKRFFSSPRRGGTWEIVAHFPTERRAIAAMKTFASPLVITKYYDEHGCEEIGGW